MEVVVRGKNIGVDDLMRDYVTKKLSKLDKFFHKLIDATVVFSLVRGRIKSEVTMTASGIVLRAEGEGPDWRTSFETVDDKLERQVKRYKEKLARRGALKSGEALSAIEINEILPQTESEEKIPGKLVRTKEFILRPMTVEDAILQMELLIHSFFVYKDMDNNKVQILYKRNDGDYGLIDPVY